MKRPRIGTLAPRLAIADLRTARAPAKTADPHYQTAEHRDWRELVIRRAGGRCEYLENGKRCERSEANGDRMFAHHVDERSDGGASLDPNNGRCVCGSHHTIVTNRNRAQRDMQAQHCQHSAPPTAGWGFNSFEPRHSNRLAGHAQKIFRRDL